MMQINRLTHALSSPRSQALKASPLTPQAHPQREGIEWINPKEIEKALNLYVDKNYKQAELVKNQIRFMTEWMQRYQGREDKLWGKVTSSMWDSTQELYIKIKNTPDTLPFSEEINVEPVEWRNPNVFTELKKLKAPIENRLNYYLAQRYVREAFTGNNAIGNPSKPKQYDGMLILPGSPQFNKKP